MSVSNPQKTVNRNVLSCDGMTTVTISFDTAAELIGRPADIILVMDRSGSMNPVRMDFAKQGARQLIEMVAAASGGTAQTIANGTRMGLISFSDLATADVQLTSDTASMFAAVDALRSGGFTNHKAAFEEAHKMMDMQSSNDQIVIMFTDGITTTGGDAAPTAEAIRQAGGEIYCIGLVTDPAILNTWATDPDEIHVAYTDNPEQLDRVFREIAMEVIHAGAHDVVITEQLNPDFKIISLHTPTDGTVDVQMPQKLIWKMDAAGAVPQGNTSLSFDIMHIGTTGGTKNVNQSLVYRDREQNTVTFPSPQVEVDCSGTVIYPEPCPSAAVIHVDGCKDSVVADALETKLSSLGRIVQVDVTIRNICPGKRVAVAVLLTEEGPNGEEYNRGMKTMTIAAQHGTDCQDILLECIPFVVPEDLDAMGNPSSICNDRTFKVRVLANYIDTDFVCCDPETVIL